MPPSVGYAIADVATLTAIGSGDRDDGYARLLLNDGNGRRFWVTYDDAATSGDYQPDDTPATGYWKKVDNAGREVLSANTTRYVDGASGNDSNDGSSSGAGAWATLTAAATYAKQIDFNGFTLTIQVADGTYTAGFILESGGLPGKLILRGNTITPANCIISTTNSNAIAVTDTSIQVDIEGFKLETTTDGDCLFTKGAPTVNVIGLMDYGDTPRRHLSVIYKGEINVRANYTVSGDSSRHILCSNGSLTIRPSSGTLTVTLSGTPTFTYWADVGRTGVFFSRDVAFSGSGTGVRYIADTNSVIDTGEATTFFPGNSAGSQSNGGEYV